MTNRNINSNEPSGLFVYRDPKHGIVYYDFFRKNGYVLTKSDYSSYSKFSMLKIICLISIFLFVEFLEMEIWKATIIGVILYICMEIVSRVTFVYKLPVIEGYKPIKKDKIYDAMANKMSTFRIVVTSLIALVTAVLIIVYAYSEKFTGVNLFVTYLLALIMAILFVCGIIAIIKKKNRGA